MTVLVRLAVVWCSAALYGLTFPPRPQSWLAWFALVPLLAVLRSTGPVAAVGWGWVWTVVMAYAVNDWFPRAVSGYFEQPVTTGVALFFGVSTFTAGIEYAAFAWWYRRARTVAMPLVPLVVAAGWVAAELGRVTLLGGDPWAVLGYSQVGVLSLMQVAEVAGVHGISFVVMAVNAALVELWRPDRARPPAPALGVAVALVIAVVTGGSLRIPAVEPEVGPAVPVAVVQSNLDVGSQWRDALYGTNLDVHLRHSVAAVRQPGTLLVWPESALTFFLADEPAYRRAIAAVLDPRDVELVAGGPFTDGGATPRYFNSAFLLTPAGDVRARYDKQWLMPFAESFPFDIDLLRRQFGRVREFSVGTAVGPLPARGARLGIVICNEAFFGDVVSARVRDGATLLVNLANDSWLGDPKFSEPAFAMVRLRAVEQRRWLIRSSTAGPSALIDPVGRVVHQTGWAEAGTLSGVVHARDGLSLYARVGDAFAWGCVVVAGIAGLATRRRRPQASAPEETAVTRARAS